MKGYHTECTDTDIAEELAREEFSKTKSHPAAQTLILTARLFC